MTPSLSSRHFPVDTPDLEQALAQLLRDDLNGGEWLPLLARYQRILGDNARQAEWEGVNRKLLTLFQCGRAVPLDGPMIGISLSLRDPDLLRGDSGLPGQERSLLAEQEIMASLWNQTLSSSGLWMGKTFEPVERVVVERLCAGEAGLSARYDSIHTRIGRNFFRGATPEPLVRGLVMPLLTQYWDLRERPSRVGEELFDTVLTEENLRRELPIPYERTGGLFLAAPGQSVLPELAGKRVYQLDYRLRALRPRFPMHALVDELVEVAEGIYLGQLVMATRLSGTMQRFMGRLGTLFEPLALLSRGPAADGEGDGYRNNGFFLLVDPDLARQVYADDAFPAYRPRLGEASFALLGYSPAPVVTCVPTPSDWRADPRLQGKFTTLLLEPSPNPDDRLEEVHAERRPHESVLEMLQRFGGEIAAEPGPESLVWFDKLHRLFRCGVAPRVANGLFQPAGGAGNSRIDCAPERLWEGAPDPCRGLDFYHGATLTLHWGFGDPVAPDTPHPLDPLLLPPLLVERLLSGAPLPPHLLDLTWKSIGKYIFPWAGKSFERISGRKLSQLLDESDDLERRYPRRVAALRRHVASLPHYDLVKRARDHYWPQPGRFASHLVGGSWDHGMSEADRLFWEEEADRRWVFGCNLQDERILAADALFRTLDLNYGPLDPQVEQAARASGSPFVRQGYVFLGVAGQPSILPVNNHAGQHKTVFQFHYRYPLVGGAFPIGLCLDELVEVASGLFLGQLIYATALGVPFHSSTPVEEYQYRLFGYFLLLDDDWERHRQAIGLDVWRPSF